MSQEASAASHGPLTGIRVIDFTSIYSGPIGTSILIPAALPVYSLAGNATILRTTIP